MNPYPIGSIYLSVNSTNPATLFGGTREQIKDRFMLACGNTYPAGSTGGEAEHVLTEAEMPNHAHIEQLGDYSEPNQVVNTLRRKQNGGTTNDGFIQAGYTSGLGDYVRTASAGGSKPHNNMPPYLAVYVWYRVS